MCVLSNTISLGNPNKLQAHYKTYNRLCRLFSKIYENVYKQYMYHYRDPFKTYAQSTAWNPQGNSDSHTFTYSFIPGQLFGVRQQPAASSDHLTIQ